MLHISSLLCHYKTFTHKWKRVVYLCIIHICYKVIKLQYLQRDTMTATELRTVIKGTPHTSTYLPSVTHCWRCLIASLRVYSARLMIVWIFCRPNLCVWFHVFTVLLWRHVLISEVCQMVITDITVLFVVDGVYIFNHSVLFRCEITYFLLLYIIL